MRERLCCRSEEEVSDRCGGEGMMYGEKPEEVGRGRWEDTVCRWPRELKPRLGVRLRAMQEG